MRSGNGPAVEVTVQSHYCHACGDHFMTTEQLEVVIAEVKRATEEAQRNAADVLGSSPEQPTSSTPDHVEGR